MVESSGLLNRRRALKLYRGFESLPLRQINYLHGIMACATVGPKTAIATHLLPDFFT